MKEYLELIKHPRAFFRSIAKENVHVTIKKAAPILIPLLAVYAVLNFIITKDLYKPLGIEVPASPFTIFWTIISLPIGLVFTAAILHIGLKVLKAKPRFNQTLKILIYIAVLTYAVGILYSIIIFLLPNQIIKIVLFFLLALVIGIWFIILTVKGLSEIYKISTGRAVGAYFLAFGIIIAAFIILMIILIILGLIIGLIVGALK